MQLTWPIPDPQRLVVAGDWHGNTNYPHEAYRVARAMGADLVLQLGDLNHHPPGSGAAWQMRETIQECVERSGIPFAFIDGNHEDFDTLLNYPIDPASGLRVIGDQVWHIPRASAWTWHGLRFRALGGGTSLDAPSRTLGVSWWIQEAINDSDIAETINGGPCDVLLTHDCPTGVDIPGIGHRDYRDRAYFTIAELERAWYHRDRLAEVTTQVQPAHLWHGHFHRRYQGQAQLAPGQMTAVEGLGAGHHGMRANLMIVDLGPGTVRVLADHVLAALVG